MSDATLSCLAGWPHFTQLAGAGHQSTVSIRSSQLSQSIARAQDVAGAMVFSGGIHTRCLGRPSFSGRPGASVFL